MLRDDSDGCCLASSAGATLGLSPEVGPQCRSCPYSCGTPGEPCSVWFSVQSRWLLRPQGLTCCCLGGLRRSVLEAAQKALCPAEGPAQPMAGGEGGSGSRPLEPAGEARRLTGGGPSGQLPLLSSPGTGFPALTCFPWGSCLLLTRPCGGCGLWPSLLLWCPLWG